VKREPVGRWTGAPYLASAATGLLLVVLFPAFHLALLAPLALVPLLVALSREPRPRRRFWLGCVAGWIFWGGTCYWIHGVLREHGRVPAAGALALFVAFFLVKGLHLGVFGWLAGALLSRPRPWAAPAVAAVWTALEGSHPYTGFTWLMLGNAATDMAAIPRLAPLTGIGGLSFLLALMNAVVALTILRRPRVHLAWLLAAPALYLLPPLPGPERGRHMARLVQPNISQSEIDSRPWTRERAQEFASRLIELSSAEPAMARWLDLIAWPENPAPLYFYDDPIYRLRAESLARQRQARLALSTVAFRDTERLEPLNSAVLLGPDGGQAARYDKIHLVPFGEFVPWPLGRLVQKVTREAGDFVAGDRVVVAQADGRRIGTFICYESVFGGAVRQFVAGGAELLINLSNDGWFGRSAAREQHLLIARMRAMENARWLLRATNTGVTAAIDPAGRIRASLAADRPAALDASFNYDSSVTPYARWGDWFWWLTVAGAWAAVAASRGGGIQYDG